MSTQTPGGRTMTPARASSAAGRGSQAPVRCGSLRQPALPCPLAQVHGDYDCTLNQTNIGNNNNKFYIIQLLEDRGRFACWNRWGRVVSVRPSHLLHVPRLSRLPPPSPASPSSAQAPAAQGPTPYSGPKATDADRPRHPAQGLAAPQASRCYGGSMVGTPLKTVNCRGRWASPSSATSRPWRMQRRTLRRNFGTRPRTAGRSGSTSWPTPASTRSSKCKAGTRPRRQW